MKSCAADATVCTLGATLRSPVRPVAKGTYSRGQLQAAGVQDNWAPSVRIPAGWTVTIYAEDGFAGQSWTRTADTPNFVALSPNANDQLTSCRIK
jgi:hypothetical protein